MFENQELPNIISKSTWANKEEEGKLTAIRESIFLMLLWEGMIVKKNIEKMSFYDINNCFYIYMEYKYDI